jgi:hypothetical protein
MNNQFSFFRIRFGFEALEPVRFAEGKAGNTFRGALGWSLRETSPTGYQAWFEPKQPAGTGPSGFADPPRPFVLRAGHLDGRTFEPGETFTVDVHLFDVKPPELFARAWDYAASRGFGPLRGRARLCSTLFLDLEDRPLPAAQPNVLSLLGSGSAIPSLTVRFVTPTELKVSAEVARTPEFPILFARVRDRIRTLSASYGEELTLDFAGLTRRAANVALVSHTLIRDRRQRTSRKTGQTHPLGGFRGEAEYAGELYEFAPLLEAARWTGIGRQTVWGKGAIEIRY